MEEELSRIICRDEEWIKIETNPENLLFPEVPMENDIDSRKAFIEKLAYFEQTNRFRDNERYKNATFKEYLWAEYGMTFSQYGTEHLIFSKYLDDVKEVGLEAVKKILKKRG